MIDPKHKPDDSIFIHAPLPYIVTARVIVSEDLPPERHEVRLVAYSILEAIMQASIQLGGDGLEDSHVKVELIAPDLDRYMAMLIETRLAVGRTS